MTPINFSCSFISISRRAVLAACAVLVFAASAQASLYEVTTVECKILKLIDGKWTSVPTSSVLQVGNQLSGGPYRAKPTIIHIKLGDEQLLFPMRCLKDVAAAPDPAATPSPPSVPAPVPPVAAPETSPQTQAPSSPRASSETTVEPTPTLNPKVRIAALVSYLSWQESIALMASSGGTQYGMLSNTLGVCAGAEAQKSWKSWIDLGLGVCGIFARSETGVLGGETLPVTYSAKNVTVFGVNLTPGLYFKPTGEGTSFGFTLPVIYRQGNWPNPSSKYVIYAGGGTSLGFQLAARHEEGHFVLSPKFGYFQVGKRLLWSIDLGYRF